MVLTATTISLLSARRLAIQDGLARVNTTGSSQEWELFLIESLLGEIGSSSSVTSLGTFQATANGTGYSNGDIIVALSDGTWRNATTGATIAAPNPADLGTFGGAVDFEIILWRATAVNAGLGYAVGDYLYEVFNTTTGGTSWYRNGAALGGIPPEAEREIPGGGSTTSIATAIPYQIDGTGPVLYGTLSADRTQIESIPPGTTTTIGTGAGEAQLTGSESESGGSGSIQKYTYTEVGGTATLEAWGIAKDGLTATTALYPTAYDALLQTNPLTVGVAAGNVDQPSITLAQTETTAPFSIGSPIVIPIEYTIAQVTANFTQPAVGGNVTITIGTPDGNATALQTAGVRFFYADSGGNEGLYEVVSGTATTVTAQLIAPVNDKYTNAGPGTNMVSGNNIVTQSFIPEIADAAWTHVSAWIRAENALLQLAVTDVNANFLKNYYVKTSTRPTDFTTPLSPWNEWGDDGNVRLSAADVPGFALYANGNQPSEQAYLYVEYLGGEFNAV